MGIQEKIQPFIMVILAIIVLLVAFGGLASIIISTADNAQYPNAVDHCKAQGYFFNVTHSVENCTISEGNSTLESYPIIKALPMGSLLGRSGFLLFALVIAFILVIYGIIKNLQYLKS